VRRSLTPRRFITLLGGFPKREPLRTSVLGSKELPQYTRKLVEYTTEGTERVQAFLLVPHGAKKAPAVIAIHQSGGTRPYRFGKSEPAGLGGDPELAYGLELCLRGYVVICPDRLPFESRALAKSRFRRVFAWKPVYTRSGGADFDLSEDVYLGCIANRLLFEGRTLEGAAVYELQRALDCLCERPEVASRRLGMIGHSGGGWFGTLLMYVDPRVKAGCVSCGTWLQGWNYRGDTMRPFDGLAGMVIPGLGRWGDVDDILAGLAPRPFLEIRGDLRAGPPGAKAALTAKAKARYADLGVPERFQYDSYRGGHEFRKDKREKAYAWLDRWLRKSPD
jgi:dienelactone hydrolase